MCVVKGVQFLNSLRAAEGGSRVQGNQGETIYGRRSSAKLHNVSIGRSESEEIILVVLKLLNGMLAAD